MNKSLINIKETLKLKKRKKKEGIGKAMNVVIIHI